MWPSCDPPSHTEAGWVGHFISCRMLRELSQFWRATSFGFSGLVFSVLRQTLPFFLIHACSPGLHSELLAFQGGSSSLHQCEKLELEYEFHLGPGLIVSELSAHLPAGGESRSVSSPPAAWQAPGGGWKVLKPQRTAWLSVGVLSPDALRLAGREPLPTSALELGSGISRSAPPRGIRRLAS